jgi:hypothetical protein
LRPQQTESTSQTQIPAKAERSLDPAFRDSIIVSVIGAGFYLALLAADYDSNGIVIARRVEVAYVASPNHMLFELTGVVLMRLAALFGRKGPVFPMLLVLAAVYGGLALGAANVAARRLGASRLEALTAVVWLGTTYAFWRWSTNVAYVSAGAMFAASAVALIWGRKSAAILVMTGILGACSALAWQGNVFLFPVLIAGVFLQPASWPDRARETKYIFTSYALTLAVAYAGMVYQSGFRDAARILKWMTSYGGGGGPDWGHWGWSRIGNLAETWIHSCIGSITLVPAWFLSHPVRLNTVFPRLAPLALLAFFGLPLGVLFRRWKDSQALFCLFGIAAYLPFIVWWDPFETKWMLIPDLFLALCVARCWSYLNVKFRLPSRLLMFTATGVLGVSNLVSLGLPQHHESKVQEAGECVGSHLLTADIYLSPEWDFGAFISQKYSIDSMDLIGRTVEVQFDKTRTFQAIEEEVRKHQTSGGDAYIPDPLSRHFELLERWAGITSSDLDHLLPGRVAYRCGEWSIRKIGRLKEGR